MSSQSQNTNSYSGYVTTSPGNAGNSSRLGIIPTRDSSDITRQIREQIVYSENNIASAVLPGVPESSNWQIFNNGYRLSYQYGKLKCAATVTSTTVSITTFAASVGGFQLVTTVALGTLAAGATITITGAASAANNGTFTVFAINIGAGTFVCNNSVGVSASSQSATGIYQNSTSICTGGAFNQYGVFSSLLLVTAPFITLPNSGGNDVFIAQYNSIGVIKWAARIAGSGNDGLPSISSNLSSNNINVVCQSSSTPLTSVYNKDGNIFGTISNGVNAQTIIAQYTSTGDVNWIARIGSRDMYMFGSCTDSSGNINITGAYNQSGLTAYDKNDTAFGTTLALLATFDVFIAQYSSTGSVNWLARMGSATASTFDYGSAICVDTSGNINITGYYQGPFTAYNYLNVAYGTTLTNSGANDVYIAQYSSTGNVNWVASISGTGTEQGTSICTDSSGNITVCGSYSSTTLTAYNYLNVAYGTTLANTGANAYIAQYSSIGNVNWLARFSSSAGFCPANGIYSDSSGNINIVGNYQGTLTAYNYLNSAFGTTLTSSGGNDVFIAQYTSTGNVNWIARIGGTNAELGISICTDSSGNITVTGNYSSIPLTAYDKNGIAFGRTLTNANSAGNTVDTFVVQYTSAGLINWVNGFGSSSNEYGTDICADSNKNINIAGYYTSAPLNISTGVYPLV